MSPVYGLWVGLVLIYSVVTGKGQMVITAFDQLFHRKLKSGKKGEVKK